MRGAGASRCRDNQRADRAASCDEHTLAKQWSRAAYRVKRNRKWLGHGGFGIAQRIRHNVGLRSINHDLLAKRALDVRRAHCAAVVAHVEAVVLQTLLAIFAVSARAAGTDRTRVPTGMSVTSAPMPETTPDTSCPSTIGSLMRTVPKPP